MTELDSAEQPLALYGTAQSVAPVRRLVAGGWQCDLCDGELSNICWRGVEVVRGVAYLLRDGDWGTVPAKVSGLSIDAAEQAFEARFQLDMDIDRGHLCAEAVVSAHADGLLAIEVRARPNLDLLTNRCGFVVLHPAAAAGCDLDVEHTDGRCEKTRFPIDISPSQPVFDIRGLRYRPAVGLEVSLRLEAELPDDPAGKFEMEDQRNWSDASFKTYVASLLDPWPYVLPADRWLTQRVTVKVQDLNWDPAHRSQSTTPDAPPAASAESVTMLALGSASTNCMPSIGVGVPMGLAQASESELVALRALGAGWWIAEVDLRQDAAAAQVTALASARGNLAVSVQLDVIAPDDLPPDRAAACAAELCCAADLVPQAVRFLPAALLQSFQPSDLWPEVAALEAYAAAARAAFPQAQVGGGVFTSFTELNRKRQAATGLDFIGHLTCPIVHSPGDMAVMQTLESLPHIARSVRALWPELGYRLGPSTLAPRRNPYGTGTVPNPNLVRAALADRDPRHAAAFGAAWVGAYAVAVADQSLEVLALLESHGPNGPMIYRGCDGYDRSVDGDALCAAWGVLGILAGAQGAQIVAVTGFTDSLVGMAWTHDGTEVHSLIVNCGSQPRMAAWASGQVETFEVGPYEVRHDIHRAMDAGR